MIFYVVVAGAAAAVGPDAGKARELPSRRGQEGAHQAHDHRGQALQARESGRQFLLKNTMSKSHKSIGGCRLGGGGGGGRV